MWKSIETVNSVCSSSIPSKLQRLIAWKWIVLTELYVLLQGGDTKKPERFRRITTHISFSSWSRVDCSCSTFSCSWASTSSWLVLSSSCSRSSFVCFSLMFSTLVTCCSLCSVWYCCSSWGRRHSYRKDKGMSLSCHGSRHKDRK